MVKIVFYLINVESSNWYQPIITGKQPASRSGYDKINVIFMKRTHMDTVKPLTCMQNNSISLFLLAINPVNCYFG